MELWFENTDNSKIVITKVLQCFLYEETLYALLYLYTTFFHKNHITEFLFWISQYVFILQGCTEVQVGWLVKQYNYIRLLISTILSLGLRTFSVY